MNYTCINRFGISALAFAPFLPKVTAPVAKAGIEVGFWAGIGVLILLGIIARWGACYTLLILLLWHPYSPADQLHAFCLAGILSMHRRLSVINHCVILHRTCLHCALQHQLRLLACMPT